VTVVEVRISYPDESANHEEAEAQEGKVDHWDANRIKVKATDSHEDESPEDDGKVPIENPRRRWTRPQEFLPREGPAQPGGRNVMGASRCRRGAGAW
jgi:hypothetical protein